MVTGRTGDALPRKRVTSPQTRMQWAQRIRGQVHLTMPVGRAPTITRRRDMITRRARPFWGESVLGDA